MLSHPAEKYRPYPPIALPDRRWPDRQISHAPRWLSTDLRDGNQALAEPMDSARKLQFWDLLLECGFKEIEVAFPSASQTDFNFVRQLIDEQRIPEDVTIQVLTQARDPLILRTFEALRGARRATVHLYNATAPLFRELVFGMDKAEVIALATRATRLIRQQCEQQPETRWQYEYSPETFCFTEPEFALEICEAVADVWQPCAERPMIVNLPATVEVNTPNVYADQIEYFCRHFSRRGDPLDTDTMIGAQASRQQFDKILSYIQIAREEGGQILTGGERAAIAPALDNGFYIQPTLIKGRNDMRSFQEEIFGPVIGVTTFKDEAEALAIANETQFGLGAGVWTRDTNLAYRMGRGIKAGRVWTNCYHVYPAHAAFGGYKQSGVGRETHKMALDAYQQTKNLLVSYGTAPLGLF